MNELPNVRERLLAVYRQAGLDVHTGWNLHCVRNNPPGQLTGLKKNGHLLETGGAGVGWNEIPCFEMLSQNLSPRRILVIGNSWGWSTLMLSTLWPQAQVVAMDTGHVQPTGPAHRAFDRMINLIRGEQAQVELGNFGIDLTNKLAAEHRFNAKAVLSESPKDVKRVTEEHLKGAPDFIFIDGKHTPLQVALDFNGCRECADPDCVYLFHDIINWELVEAFETCKTSSGLSGGLLRRTTSGMGLLFPKTRPEMERVLQTFGGEAERRGVGWRVRVADFIARMIIHNPLVRLLTGANNH